MSSSPGHAGPALPPTPDAEVPDALTGAPVPDALTAAPGPDALTAAPGPDGGFHVSTDHPTDPSGDRSPAVADESTHDALPPVAHAPGSPRLTCAADADLHDVSPFSALSAVVSASRSHHAPPAASRRSTHDAELAVALAPGSPRQTCAADADLHDVSPYTALATVSAAAPARGLTRSLPSADQSLPSIRRLPISPGVLGFAGGCGRFLRRWTLRLAALVLVLAAVAVWLVARYTDDESVRTLIETELAARLNTRVSVAGAHLQLLSGRLDVRGVVIHAPDARPGEPPAFRAESLRADLSLWNLLWRDGPVLLHLEADRPEVTLVEYEAPAGGSNLASLAAGVRPGSPDDDTRTGARLPDGLVIELRSVRLERRRRVPAGLEPCGRSTALDLRLSADPADPAFTAFRLAAPQVAYRPVFEGRIRPDPFRIEVAGGPMGFGAEIADCLPDEFRPLWAEFAPEVALGRVQFAWSAGEKYPTASAELLSGRALLPAWKLDKSRPPAPPPPVWNSARPAPDFAEITDLAGKVRVSPAGLRVEGLAGRLNGIAFQIDGDLRGRHDDPAATLTLKAGLRGLDIERTLWAYRSLNPGIDEVLKQIEPRGQVDADVSVEARLARLLGDKTAPKPVIRATAALRNAQVYPRAFKYLVQNINGTAVFEDSSVRFDLKGGRNGGTIDVAGRIGFSAARYAELDFTVRGRNTPLDDEVSSAIPAEDRRHYTDWNLRGKADSDVWVYRPANDTDDSLGIRITVTCNGEASFCYDDLPLRVNRVRGIVEIFAGMREQVGGRVHTLIGEVDGGTVSLEGEAGLAGGLPRMWAEFRTKDLPLSAEFAAALPEDGSFRKTYQSFHPGGRADLIVRIQRGWRPAKWPFPEDRRAEYDIRAVTRDGRVKFDGFPYELTDVNGSLRVRRDLIEVTGMTARHGQAAMTMDGTVVTRGAGRLDLRMGVRDLLLDGDLRAALEPAHRARLEDNFVAGPVDAEIRLTGALDDPRGPRTEIDAVAKGLSLRPAPFPVRLQDVRGEMSLRPEGLTIGMLTARREQGAAGEGTLLISGRILEPGANGMPPAPSPDGRAQNGAAGQGSALTPAPSPDGSGKTGAAGQGEGGVAGPAVAADSAPSGTAAAPPPQVDLLLAGSNLLLDREMYDALPPATRRKWDLLRPEGTVDVAGRIFGPPQPDGAEPAPAPASPMTGADPGPSSSASDPGRASAVATTPSSVPADRPAAGAIAGPAPRPAAGLRPEVMIATRRFALTPAGFPYRFDAVVGSVSVQPEAVRWIRATARHGESEWTISGGHRGAAFFEVTAAARKLALDDDLRRAMPDAVRKGLVNLDPQGRFDLDMNLVACGTDIADTVWQFDGRLGMDGASMDIGQRAGRLRGTLRAGGELFTRTGMWHASGGFTFQEAEFRGLPLTEVAGRFSKPAESDVLTVLDLAGRTCGGLFGGSAELGLAGKGRYSFRIAGENVDLHRFVTAWAGKPSVVSGRTDIQVSARGAKEGRDEEFEMAGAVIVRDGRIGDAAAPAPAGPAVPPRPVAPPPPDGGIPVRQTPPAPAPGTAPVAGPAAAAGGAPAFAFDTAAMKFRRRGDAWQFEDVQLAAPGLKLAGRGTIDNRDRLDLTFYLVPPKEGLRIPVFGEVLRGVTNELVQLRVTGPASDPKLGTRTGLNTFTDPLTELLRKPLPLRPDLLFPQPDGGKEPRTK